MPIAGRRFRTVCASSGRIVLIQCICALRVESQRQGRYIAVPCHSPNPSWTGRLREVCAQIQEEYIFITLEDHWLAGKIDQEKIVADVTLLRQHKEVGVVYLDYLTPTMPIWSKDGGYREIPGRHSVPPVCRAFRLAQGVSLHCLC